MLELLQPSSQMSPRDKNFHCSSLSLVQLVKDIWRFNWPSNSNPSNGINVYPCCCDGLFLIGIWNKAHQEDPSILLIWNPSTGESLVLPPSELSPHASSYELEYDSTYDDCKEASIYGLGYDSINDDYKVFKIGMSEDYQEDQILALKSGSWRIIDETSGETDNILLFEWPRLVFVHGAFHWLGIVSRFTVVSFNISDEKYREIQLPEIMCSLPLSNITLDTGVSALGGTLCVYCNIDKENFNLWVMKEYDIKISWTKLFTIPSNGVRYIIPIYQGRASIKIVYRIVSDGSFGLSNRIWPLDYDDVGAVTIAQDGIAYTESLISPKLGR